MCSQRRKTLYNLHLWLIDTSVIMQTPNNLPLLQEGLIVWLIATSLAFFLEMNIIVILPGPMIQLIMNTFTSAKKLRIFSGTLQGT